MSRLFNGSSDKLRVGAANGASPISFAAWIYPTSVTGVHYVAVHGDSAVDTMLYALYLSGSTLVANHYDGDNANSTKTSVTINTWHHVAAVFATASSRTVYLDGVAGTENTTTQTAGTASDYIAAGVLEWPGGDLYHFAGRIAEWALYDKALSAAEVLQLSKDFAPSLVQPNSLNVYMPLLGVQSTPRDLINGPVWTLTGTSKAAHPRIFYPESPRIVPVHSNRLLLIHPPGLQGGVGLSL